MGVYTGCVNTPVTALRVTEEGGEGGEKGKSGKVTFISYHHITFPTFTHYLRAEFAQFPLVQVPEDILF